jgi:glucose-1-phosphate cytidylyltransferase
VKVVILAGGLGTRLAEETDLIPKPMVTIGDDPILLHIMRHYAGHSFGEFVIALGYKGNVIKRFMVDYQRLGDASATVDMATGDVTFLDGPPRPDWKVHLLETGLNTMTSGRVRRAMTLTGDEPFMLTYGDGVSDVDLTRLLEFHRAHGKLATVTIVRPKSLFGHMEFDGDRVTEFLEKPQTLGGWINGGFMVMEPGVLDYLGGDDTPLERSALPRLAKDGELMAYRHEGFWQCMDSLRDKRMLDQLWNEGNPPWKTWGE